MLTTKNSLPAPARTQMAHLLNQRLADCIDLQTQVKQAHWNVRGPAFIALHKLFDEVNEAVEDYVDEIAERAAQLGGAVQGTARVVAATSRLPEYPLTIVTGLDHVRALSTALAAFGKSAREAVAEADKVDDPVTADLFTEVARGIDQWLWFVESHIQAEA